MVKYDKYKNEPYKETENERICRECSINPQTKKQDQKSIDETKSILQAKREGTVSDVSRPENPLIDLDFRAKGLKNYDNITHVDIKTPPSLEKFELQRMKVSGPNTYDKIATSMGNKLPTQKARFCGLKDGPVGPENVVYLIDLRNIPNYRDKAIVVRNVLDAAQRAGNTTENIIFLNFD